MSETYLIRIGGVHSSKDNTCWIVRLSDTTTRNTFVQASATRFGTIEEARALIHLMIERGDTWADYARPVRLMGKRTITRKPA